MTGGPGAGIIGREIGGPAPWFGITFTPKGVDAVLKLHAGAGRFVLVLAILSVASLLLVACGGGGGDGGGEAAAVETEFQYQKIKATGLTYTIDDLKATGFKKSKTYKVEELPEAKSAYFGFWGLDPYNRFDYEVRFYETHEDAIEHGTWWADQRVGKDAPLSEKEAPWKEGIKDARSCKGDLASGPASHGIQACTSPKYYEYAIYGNMILFCQGDDDAEATENCRLLLTEMEKAAASGG